MTDNNQSGSLIEGLQNHTQEESERLKSAPMPTKESVLHSLLKQIKAVDFRELAELESPDDKLNNKHYLIISVQEVMRLAKVNKWDLCQKYAFTYVYNGAYWGSIDAAGLTKFLQSAAEKMGVRKYESRFYEFGDKLQKQFNSSAQLTTPEMNNDIVKINLANGTFEISADKQILRDFDSKDFLTYQLPFAYNPEAKAPLFHQFLNKVQPDTDSQKVLAEYLGYVFTPSAKFKLEKALLLYGDGANGKSVFYEIVKALLGPENTCHYSLQSLTTHPAYCRAELGNKLVNYASEINGKMETDTFKQLVSGEDIEARVPYGQPFILKDYAKMIFNCNKLPVNTEQTNAFFRRFIIIPFGVTILESEQDKHLAEKIIKDELSGVFNWVLDGLQRLLKQGRFTDCAAANQQLEEFKRDSDSVRQFIEEYEYEPVTDSSIKQKDLYGEYTLFCKDSGCHPVGLRNFVPRLEKAGFRLSKTNVGKVVFAQRKHPLNSF